MFRGEIHDDWYKQKYHNDTSDHCLSSNYHQYQDPNSSQKKDHDRYVGIVFSPEFLVPLSRFQFHQSETAENGSICVQNHRQSFWVTVRSFVKNSRSETAAAARQRIVKWFRRNSSTRDGKSKRITEIEIVQMH
jgi:hypothetical protein